MDNFQLSINYDHNHREIKKFEKHRLRGARLKMVLNKIFNQVKNGFIFIMMDGFDSSELPDLSQSGRWSFNTESGNNTRIYEGSKGWWIRCPHTITGSFGQIFTKYMEV